MSGSKKTGWMEGREYGRDNKGRDREIYNDQIYFKRNAWMKPVWDDFILSKYFKIYILYFCSLLSKVILNIYSAFITLI